MKLIILNKLDEHRKYDKFISYLKRTWFKKGRKDFNYSKVIKEYYNNIKIIDKIYLTNNIIESLHSKINSYLPKHKTTVYNFIKSLENVIFNDTIKNISVKRYDFKTRSLLILIDKENLNNNVHWVDYEVFIKYLNAINLNNNSNSTLYNLVEAYELEAKSNNSIFKFNNRKGLNNLAFTCYLNSIIQILFSIKEFRNFILDIQITKEDKNVLYSIYKIFYELNNSNNNKNYIETNDFINNYDDEKINIYEQKDAHEFFLDLIDKLEKRLIKYKKEKVFKYLFNCKINTILKCCINAKHTNTKKEIFYSINLEVKDKENVCDSLKSFIKCEYIDNENMVYRTKCKKRRNMYKYSNFLTLPRIFVIVLKRFEFNEILLRYIKINNYFKFPEILDFSKFITDKNSNNLNNKYVLFGVVIHKGLTYSGHYYTIIKEDNTNYWIKLDDASTNIVKDDDAKKIFFGEYENSENAYILFYKKTDWSNCEKFENYNIKNINNFNYSDNIINYEDKSIIDLSGSSILEDDVESIEDIHSNNNFDLFLERLDDLNLDEKRDSDHFDKSKEKQIFNINTDIGYNCKNKKKLNNF